ncbi:hypothetical protein ERJ75_001275800 [Trypanosoma vivax]|nr:hypothetical protein ERJ75_001275800 [Trypanosoma vivax]
MARARDNYRHETETSSAMQAAVQPEQEPVRTLPRAMREVCVGQGGENDPTTDPWMQERVGTKRYLHKKEWRRGWRCAGRRSSATARPARRSDAADSLSSWTLFARTLRWGRGEAQRRRDAVAGQAARAAGARNGIPQTRERRTGSAGRGCAARRTAARVEMLCMLNAAGRAARMLTRDGEDLVRSSAAEVVREVDGLYPQEDVSTFPQPPLPVTVVGVEKDEVSRAIRRRLTRGAAPGLDGWTRELLYPLTQDSALLMEVTVLTADILNGNVSEQMAHRLRATALTILRKPNGKYRPIGAESVWAKLASMVAFDRVVEASRRIFAGVQFGLVGRSSWRLRACGRTLRRRQCGDAGRVERVQRHQPAEGA